MQFLRNAGAVSDTTADAFDRLDAHLAAARGGEDSLAVLAQLRRASEELTGLTEEALAAAVLEGHSVRTVAQAGGMAPNSVPPRLARSSSLAGYTTPGGRLGAPEIARARHDAGAVTPLTFVRRRPGRGDAPREGDSP